jgi:N-succinyldiaminopimelate aminotransferase
MLFNSDVILNKFKDLQQGGVDKIMSKARENGFTPTDPTWANLGQGSPITTNIEGDKPRIENIVITTAENGYAPIAGTNPLRQQLADYYNFLHRQDQEQKYGIKNITTAPGGRSVLTHILATISENTIVGYLNPDYTTYADIINALTAANTVPIQLQEEDGFAINVDLIESKIREFGIGVLLLSNPSNPTGNAILGEELQKLIRICSENQCVLLIDEFYSRYYYTEETQIVSSAKYIEDIENSHIVIIDGLSKGHRYPGWRMAWAIGSSAIITKITNAGSFLDGGFSHPLQKTTVELLDYQNAIQETKAVTKLFQEKRDYMVKNLRELGFIIRKEPLGAFYIWADVSGLPKAINNGYDFAFTALENKILCIPGCFFDVNPGNKRQNSRFNNYVRFSFGPDIKVMERGISMLKDFIAKYQD